ncbi:Pre-mRNA-splicing factor of RES complex-domain-containing protein [Cantharellus anzutake]|uniref:Pre-mRNA-splicing factor of RES complex-domain-containing protein n=1 Tax=Cantharellus anzutake TaxID=1750568 RepID=UPI0019052E82|nr:Pre-mRNA-splicing factor of RES complex-domain-containing protein [Cantharellus anzutake]KAF8328194.1 Pre-mRNA-splicing factor of RES complex-domain-containing protein [Cantharellus anzutake]
MMDSSKQAYLAAKYMSGAKAEAILAKYGSSDPQKKKKKKKGSDPSTSTSLIVDEDAGWGGNIPDANDGDVQEDIAKGDAIIASDRSFKKRKSVGGAGGGWETVREPTPPPAPDEQPIVVEESSVVAGGILTSAQLTQMKGKPVDKLDISGEQQETVYRDATGKKIDTKAERAAAARERRAREEKEAQKMEWGKGLVQREDKERERVELEKEKSRDLARYVDDADLNAAQREQVRWNDPAAPFLTKKNSKGPKKPEYTGPPPPPNRFGIKPGYRWDGVDRSNGFEKKLFQRANDRKRRGLEAYEWSVDDM